MLVKHKKNLILENPKAVLFDTDNKLNEYRPANTAANDAVYRKAKIYSE